jgi:hypothetical protein
MPQKHAIVLQKGIPFKRLKYLLEGKLVEKAAKAVLRAQPQEEGHAESSLHADNCEKGRDHEQ